MRTSQNNIEKSLHSLAFLIGIELKRGWKTELAKWFGVPLSLLSNWINRNALPKERMKYIEDCEYSREQWYIEEESQEGLALGDQASAEVMRGGVIVPEDPCKHDPGCILPRLVADRKPDGRQLIPLHEAEITEYMETVREILSSNDVGTREALKANIRVFADHIKTKDKVEDLEREVRQLKKSIASSPNPGKDGTDEA